MSFNDRILSLVLGNTRFDTDVESMLKRYQCLSAIYICLSMFGVICGCELSSQLPEGSPNKWLLTIIAIPLLILSLIFLRQESYNACSALIVLTMHLVNFSGAYIQGDSLASLFGLLTVPCSSFFLSPSFKIRVFNMSLTMAQFFHHTHHFQEIFKITINEEQARQINTLQSAAFSCLLYLCGITFVQKSVQANLWKIAQSNYEKSEELRREVLQASKAKDVFVSSLSHEIRNPLNALNGTIDYLLGSVTNPDHIKMLKNAKLSGEVLLNLANNVLDAAKLKAGKMDVSYTEGNFGDIIKKVFVINSESFRSKKIIAEAFIDKNLPKVLWIDSSRLLQIMMNLISNALKFTGEQGKINVTVRWCSEDQKSEDLLICSRIREFRTISNRVDGITSTIPRHRMTTARSESEPELVMKELDEFNVRDSNIRRRNLDALNRSNTYFKSMFESSQLSPHELWIIQSKDLSVRQSGYEPTKGFIKVEVSDTGCGIPEQAIPKLFEMFEQVQQTENNRREGTGLGLWICKQLCQKMDGDIKLYSRVDYGTTFIFYIPIDNQRRMSESS